VQSKEKTLDQIAEVDSTRLTAILRYTVAAFVEEVQTHGFRAPIEVRVMDRNWVTLRTFTIGEEGKIAAGRSGRRKSVCVFPLKILATDRNKRVARVRITADSSAREYEFLN
jgi:hypothetical protein